MNEDKFTLEIEGLRIVEWLSSRNKLPKFWEKNYKGSQLALTTLFEKLDKKVNKGGLEGKGEILVVEAENREIGIYGVVRKYAEYFLITYIK
jgi:hypothetical protein